MSNVLTILEKQLLNRLLVFAGGWTQDAAEYVCVGGDIEKQIILELLTSLRNKGMLAIEEQNYCVRYNFIGISPNIDPGKIADYVSNDLLQKSHRDYFLKLAEDAERHLKGGHQTEWLNRLEADVDNIHTAVQRCIDLAEPIHALRFCGALQRFWWIREYLAEGREFCAQSLNMDGADSRTRYRAKALNGAGVLAKNQGDDVSAKDYLEECLSIAREIGDERITASALNNLGNVAYQQKKYTFSRTCHEESMVIKQQLGDNIAGSLHNLGFIATHEGDFASARKYHGESLMIRKDHVDNLGIAMSLEEFAWLAAKENEPVSASTLWGAAEALRELMNSRRPSIDRDEYDCEVGKVRESMGELQFKVAWAAGREMPLEIAIELALPQKPNL